MTLTPEDVEAIATAVAQKIGQPARAVLTPGEVQRMVGKQSPSALYRWLEKNKLKPVGQGRYSRAAIERALADEAGVSYRRHQISKRKAAP